MSRSYLFFAPAKLPLAVDDLSAETTRCFTDVAAVRATLDAHLPGLAWDESPEGALARGTVSDGDALHELAVLPYEAPAESGARPAGAPDLIVSLRASGRVDSASFVQRLCDAAGWVAFDDRVYCFQPHRPPVFAGGG